MKHPLLTFCSATSCYNIDCERHSFNLVNVATKTMFQDFSSACSEYLDGSTPNSIEIKSVNSITNHME